VPCIFSGPSRVSISFVSNHLENPFVSNWHAQTTIDTVAAMSSSIGTQSVVDASIFSHSESCLSAITQWTSDASFKGGNGADEFDSDEQKQGKQMGRPNKWTCTRLRNLIKLYLLTDLELDGIIDRLRTDDFQPWLAILLFQLSRC